MNEQQTETMQKTYYSMGQAFKELGEVAEVAMAKFQLFGAVAQQQAVEEDIARTRLIYPLVRNEPMPRFWRRHQGRVRQQAKAAKRKAYRRVVQLRREGKGGW